MASASAAARSAAPPAPAPAATLALAICTHLSVAWCLLRDSLGCRCHPGRRYGRRGDGQAFRLVHVALRRGPVGRLPGLLALRSVAAAAAIAIAIPVA